MCDGGRRGKKDGCWGCRLLGKVFRKVVGKGVYGWGRCRWDRLMGRCMWISR